MASFLKKFVKSRSKSPTKPSNTATRRGLDNHALFYEQNHRGHDKIYPYQHHSLREYNYKFENDCYDEASHEINGLPVYNPNRKYFDDLNYDDEVPPVRYDVTNDDRFYSLTYASQKNQPNTTVAGADKWLALPHQKSPKRAIESPVRRVPPTGPLTTSPMLSSHPQYYFTPDYKVYEGVATEKEPAQFPYSPMLSGRTSNNYYHETRPSTSNTLSPDWQNTHNNATPRVSASLHRNASGCMNDGVAGTASFGATRAALSRASTTVVPSTPGGTTSQTTMGSPLAERRFNSSGDDMDAVSPLSAYYVPGMPFSSARTRSVSPRKTIKYNDDSAQERKFRSRSPTKRSSTRSSIAKTLDYLHAQCKLEGCSAVIIVEDTQFLVCKHQLSHASEFFRTLFLNNRALPVEGVRQTSVNEYTIVVSGLKYPPQSVQFQWFIESTVLCPVVKPITDNSLETCMRLSKRFASRGLEFRCSKFIQDNVEEKPPMMALCWLNWVFKHRFDIATHDVCLPVVARLPLRTLERHRQMLPERAVADLMAMKLRTCYLQTAKVFHTIHRMDHFHVEMDKCPRCGRLREQGKVRIQANPCQKLIGCERCMRDIGCEIERKSGTEFQAFHQCDHGLWPFNDIVEDCFCQTPLYRLNFCAVNGPSVNDNLDGISCVPPSNIPALVAKDTSGGIDDEESPERGMLKGGATQTGVNMPIGVDVGRTRISHRPPSSTLDTGGEAPNVTLALTDNILPKKNGSKSN